MAQKLQKKVWHIFERACKQTVLWLSQISGSLKLMPDGMGEQGCRAHPTRHLRIASDDLITLCREL